MFRVGIQIVPSVWKPGKGSVCGSHSGQCDTPTDSFQLWSSHSTTGRVLSIVVRLYMGSGHLTGEVLY